MLNVIIRAMIYLGSALMVFNIYGFIRYARGIRTRMKWSEGKENAVLYIPIALLVMFLLGYLAVGIFGDPDLIISGILFGGSVYVFLILYFISKITSRIIKTEHHESELMAAEQSNQAKNAFLSTVSHEMRTPLNVIIGLNASAMNEPGVPEKAKADMEKIGLSAKHLLGLINNILDINRIRSGEILLKNNVFSLCESINQINAIMNTVCEEKGLTYRVSSGHTGDCRFYGDEQMLKQVLISLLDNAVKYTESPGTVELDVSFEDKPEGACELTFAVKDTGIGIDKDFIPNLFQVFSQEDSTSTTRFGGSGLGLALTHRLVRLMGGTISVESTKNVGSVFTVTVPMQRVSGDPELQEEAPENQAEEVSLNEKRILIVEDLDENAEIVADLLELEGAVTERAENGRIALDMFTQSPKGYYDAVLMDLRMPVMDGLASARGMRASNHPDAADVPIIALTANAFESDVQHAFEAGMNAHLTKPADSQLLYSTIKKYIAQRKTGSEN